MATVAIPAPARVSWLAGAWAWMRRNLLSVYMIVALTYLFIPVVITILFSFNDRRGKYNIVWNGFTFKWWRDMFARPEIQAALGKSLQLAFFSALLACVLGTLVALAIARYQFKGRAATNLFIFLPMSTPEVVMGSSLLALFLTLNLKTGFTTILIAHTLFNVSYVVVTVKARLAGFDQHLEEAAMDLYANERTTFLKVTLPLILPGVFAAFLLAFALSFDDFIITNFNSGSTVTFPLLVWGAARVGVPPQVNVFGTLIFLIAVIGMLIGIRLQTRRQRRPKPAA